MTDNAPQTVYKKIQQPNEAASRPTDTPTNPSPTTETRRQLKRPRPQEVHKNPNTRIPSEEANESPSSAARSNPEASGQPPDDAESSPLNKRIRQTSPTPGGDEQVIASLIPLLTFWLSAANLTKDRHLLHALTENPDGWTPIQTFTTFNKARALNAGPEHLTRALRRLKHPKLELRTEVPNSAHAFRLYGGLASLRKHVGTALADEDARTIFLTHVPSRTSRETIANTFKRFGEIVYVSIPRLHDGQCRGFAFVEFLRVAQAGRVLSDWRRSAHCSGVLRDVQALPKREWARRKEARKKRARGKDDRMDREEEGGHAENGEISSVEGPPAGCSGQSVDGTVGGGADEAVANVESAPDKGEVTRLGGGLGSTSQNKMDFEKGLVVRISGLETATKGVTRATLYEQLEEFGPVSFIEFTPRRRDECTVRYMHCTGATRAYVAFMEDGANLLGGRVQAVVLRDGEETAYWQRVHNGRRQKSDRQAQKRQNRDQAYKTGKGKRLRNG